MAQGCGPPLPPSSQYPERKPELHEISSLVLGSLLLWLRPAQRHVTAAPSTAVKGKYVPPPK